jgi:hypothetical protein
MRDFPNPVKVAEWTRERLHPLVQYQERLSGSRMAAYRGVANRIGVTQRWVQRVIGREPVIIQAHQWINLNAAYRGLCERIEADAQHKRHLAAQLRRGRDATHEGIVEMDSGLSRIKES